MSARLDCPTPRASPAPPAPLASLALVASLALAAACASGPGFDRDHVVEVELAWSGGLCAGPEGGGACGSTILVRDDGTWSASGFPEPDPSRGTVASGAATELADILESGWDDLTARDFTGTCPVAYDGQEVIYTVRRLPRGQGAERADASVRQIRSCTYDLEHRSAAGWIERFHERWNELGLPG